ncbi:hypothetical protein B0H14DRAFT_3662996 [Mycena olivaceomarginata]|nr:hypothetical protein B0H14DRAFT_3662996 [Mycena olivaceomarginata]
MSFWPYEPSFEYGTHPLTTRSSLQCMDLLHTTDIGVVGSNTNGQNNWVKRAGDANLRVEQPAPHGIRSNIANAKDCTGEPMIGFTVVLDSGEIGLWAASNVGSVQGQGDYLQNSSWRQNGSDMGRGVRSVSKNEQIEEGGKGKKQRRRVWRWTVYAAACRMRGGKERGTMESTSRSREAGSTPDDDEGEGGKGRNESGYRGGKCVRNGSHAHRPRALRDEVANLQRDIERGQAAYEADVGAPLSHDRGTRLALGGRTGEERVGNARGCRAVNTGTYPGWLKDVHEPGKATCPKCSLRRGYGTSSIINLVKTHLDKVGCTEAHPRRTSSPENGSLSAFFKAYQAAARREVEHHQTSLISVPMSLKNTVPVQAAPIERQLLTLYTTWLVGSAKFEKKQKPAKVPPWGNGGSRGMGEVDGEEEGVKGRDEGQVMVEKAVERGARRGRELSRY